MPAISIAIGRKVLNGKVTCMVQIEATRKVRGEGKRGSAKHK